MQRHRSLRRRLPASMLIATSTWVCRTGPACLVDRSRCQSSERVIMLFGAKLQVPQSRIIYSRTPVGPARPRHRGFQLCAGDLEPSPGAPYGDLHAIATKHGCEHKGLISTILPRDLGTEPSRLRRRKALHRFDAAEMDLRMHLLLHPSEQFLAYGECSAGLCTVRPPMRALKEVWGLSLPRYWTTIKILCPRPCQTDNQGARQRFGSICKTSGVRSTRKRLHCANVMRPCLCLGVSNPGQVKCKKSVPAQNHWTR